MKARRPPRVAVTMGDAAGIGPEIVLKALTAPDAWRDYPAFVIGDAGILAREAAHIAPATTLRIIADPQEHLPREGVIDVLATSRLPLDLPYGRVASIAGAAAYRTIRVGIECAVRGDIDALCTAPINKEALVAADVRFAGHTEMLAVHSDTQDFAMMLQNPKLRTILVTTHCALREAIARLSVALELRILRLGARAMLRLGMSRPRIAVAGLNPHAGEGGLFGDEDARIIAPAIALARAEGIDATGPHPADTVFMQARQGRFDLVVAQYHDQGLIPIKLLGVADGVNVTVGLPFVRTSPDHGTAFDIAGHGIADPASMISALRAAHDLIGLSR